MEESVNGVGGISHCLVDPPPQDNVQVLLHGDPQRLQGRWLGARPR